MTITDNLRQPEYTGENRCTPCTAVNVVIAATVSAFAAIASTFFGVGVFIFSLAAIYLRGYLVPGTPTLTKRYFPERILRRFDKDSTVQMTYETDEIDPEQILLDTGAVEPCRENTDLCLTSDFQKMWREHVHTIRTEDLGEDQLADALDISSKDDRIRIDQHGDGFVAHADHTVVGQWGSRAAMIADVAAATVLSERFSDWSNINPEDISRLLMSLRVFIEQCPKCDGPVQVNEEVVESCCRSYDVVASACQNCDARLFEVEWNNNNVDEM